jgi:hypothetical protein
LIINQEAAALQDTKTVFDLLKHLFLAHFLIKHLGGKIPASSRRQSSVGRQSEMSAEEVGIMSIFGGH